MLLYSESFFSSGSSSDDSTWPTRHHSCLQTSVKLIPSCSKPLKQFAMAGVAVSSLQIPHSCKMTVPKFLSLQSFSSTGIHKSPSFLASSVFVLEILKAHILFLPFCSFSLYQMHFGAFVRKRAGSSWHDLIPVSSHLNFEHAVHPSCRVSFAVTGESTASPEDKETHLVDSIFSCEPVLTQKQHVPSPVLTVCSPSLWPLAWGLSKWQF